jgi:hypothetical protein
MRAELVPLADLADADLAAWRDLAGRAIEPNPFFEPHLVLAAARCIAPDEPLGLLLVRDGPSLRACVPVLRVRRGRRFPFPMLKGWRHDYSFLGSPLVDTTGADEALRVLRDGLGHHGVPRFLLLEQVGDGVAEVLSRSQRAHTIGAEERAVARLHADGPPPLGIGGKHRRELARKARALAGTYEGDLIRRLGPEPAVVDRFLALEASGWKGEAGTALASQASHRGFFRAICDGDAHGPRVEFVEVGDPEEPAAMTCMLMAGTAAFAFKIAVDERRRSASPGVQLMADVPRLLLRPGECTLVDSCADPGHDTVNRLWTERRRLTSFIVSEGAIGRTVGSVAARMSRRHTESSAA